jgi:hypothetical protein
VTNDEMLSRIDEFVRIQQKLISASFDVTRCTSPIFLKDHVPATVMLDDKSWQTSIHGIGVRFTHRNHVIDAHCGVLEFPTAFDAFRLSEYFRALGLTPNSYDEIQMRLNELQNSGLIERCVELPQHYVLMRFHNAS